MIKRKRWDRRKDTCGDFFTLVTMFKTGRILVTDDMKMYIYVHMPSLFFFFFAEASPGVQFVMASLCNVVMEKKKYKNV